MATNHNNFKLFGQFSVICFNQLLMTMRTFKVVRWLWCIRAMFTVCLVNGCIWQLTSVWFFTMTGSKRVTCQLLDQPCGQSLLDWVNQNGPVHACFSILVQPTAPLLCMSLQSKSLHSKQDSSTKRSTKGGTLTTHHKAKTEFSLPKFNNQQHCKWATRL